MLWIILKLRNCLYKTYSSASGNWLSALAVSIYATAFSYAYVNLPIGTDALLLFAAVQLTMILFGFWKGERFRIQQLLDLTIAMIGVIWLLLPNVSATHLINSLLMLNAGIAWAIYSLRGEIAIDVMSVTTRNFMLATVSTLVLSMLFISKMQIGSLEDYISINIWHEALQRLKITTAAFVQLSVPTTEGLVVQFF